MLIMAHFCPLIREKISTKAKSADMHQIIREVLWCHDLVVHTQPDVTKPTDQGRAMHMYKGRGVV